MKNLRPFLRPSRSVAFSLLGISAIFSLLLFLTGVPELFGPATSWSALGGPAGEYSVFASAAGPNDIMVSIFNDYDNDGADDGSGEPGLPGLTVTAYNAANTPAVFTDLGDGNYLFTPGNADTYRVEVTGLGDVFEPSIAGATTTFFASINTTISVGLQVPEEFYPGSEVFLTTPCYVDGSSTGANRDQDVLIAVPVSGVTNGIGNPAPTEYFIAEHDEIGATFGVAYSRPANALFAAAFLKRHTAFGPSGTGAIYKIELNGTVPTAPISNTGVAPIVDLNALFGANTAGANPHPDAGTNFDLDPATYAQVGKIGLGGLAHDGRTNTLWTINLADRRLYEIPLAGTFENPVSPVAGDISIWPATGDLTDLPGLPGTDAEKDINIRPFAVKYFRGEIYIGIVSTAESTVSIAGDELVSSGDRSQMMGYVYKFNPTTDQFTQLLTIPFDYDRGQGADFCSNNGQAEFNPWVPIFDADDFLAITMGTSSGGASFPAERVYPQPWITDLDFDESGKMIIGIRDRFADQHGYNQIPPNAGTPSVNNGSNGLFTADGAGDLLVASVNTTNQTTYVLESNSGNGAGGASFGPTTGINKGEGPANGEFFFDDRYRPANAGIDGPTPPAPNCNDVNDQDPILDPQFEQGHDEISLGGIFNYNGQNTLYFSAYDPLNDFNFFNNAGVVSLNNQDGSRIGAAQVYATTPQNNSTFAKGNGLGDVEGIAPPAGLVVGNRVWLDEDNDGIQDPDEPGINGVEVSLFKSINGSFVQVATTTTAADAVNGDGAYQFSNNGVANQNWTNGETSVLPDMEYSISVSLSSAQAVNSQLLGFTQQGTNVSNDNKTDINDSDVDNNGSVVFTTGRAGQHNPGLDAGLVACSIMVNSALPGTCVPATNQYSLDVEVTYSNLPSGEMIVISTDNGDSQTFSPATAAGTSTFTLTNLNSDGMTNIDVTAVFASSASCTAVLADAYDAPSDCAPTCDISITNVIVACSNGTDFTVSFDVTWDYLFATADMIQVSIGGVAQAPFVPVGVSGSSSFSLLDVDGPAYAILLEAAFLQNAGCATAASVDLIACTEECDDDLGGNVFNDFDNNGADAGAMEVGQANVLVEIYECDSDVPVATTWTNTDGNWSVDDTNITYPVRVEFSTPLQSYLQPSFAGTDNGTDVQFVMGGAGCVVDYGVIDPSDFCANVADLTMLTTCFTLGDAAAGQQNNGAVVSWTRMPTGANENRNGYIAYIDEVGAVAGMAYQPESDLVYVGAFAKRHSGYGPGGSGAIYVINNQVIGSGDPSNVVNTFIIPDAGNTIHGTNGYLRDSDFFDAVGKEGLGDLELSPDGKTLWTVNLNNRHLYKVNVEVENTNYGTVTDLGEITSPDCQGGNADWRPFALEYNNGKLYVGGVCSAETGNTDPVKFQSTDYQQVASGTDLSGNLSVNVLFFDDPMSSADATANFSSDLSFNRGLSTANATDGNNAGRWHPWLDQFDVDLYYRNFPGNQASINYPQPMLTDMEIDRDGALILGFRDRTGDQMGNLANNPGTGLPGDDAGNNTLYQARSGGDINRACATDTGWDWEGTGSCPTNGNSPAEFDAPDVRASTEFYPNDFFGGQHFETAQGGLFLLGATNQIATTSMDPHDFDSGGVEWFSNADGGQGHDYQVFMTAGGSNTTFAKANGLGDLEGACDPLPIQIGNYVWIDTDEDGVQDACEEPVTGLPVTLYTQDDNGTLTQVATTTTDAVTGEYYFNDVIQDTTYLIVFGDTPVMGDTTLTHNGVEYAVTQDNTGEGNNPDLNDSDGTFMTTPLGVLPSIVYSTADTTDHTLDLGLVPTSVFDLALVKRIDASTPGPYIPGSTVTYGITVYNQGDTDATDIEVKDYLPAGLSLAPASAPAWTISADTAILTTPFELAAGADSILSISFTINTDFMGDTLVNRAEISSFDDDNDPNTDPPVDEDSTPNNNGMDDPEADTPDEFDDEADGTPGTEDDPNDEDDYDFEGIPVLQSFDLNLVKVIDETATPGPFTYGSPVTFIIEVRNQGSLDATGVDVADYIPDGLTLVAGPDWTMDMDTARLAVPFDLAAGDTTRLSITFTIDLDFTGTIIDNVAEISAASNALGLRDEDSTPGDNGLTPPEVGSDDEDDDNGPNGNGTGDNPNDSDDFDLARVSIETVSLGSTVFVDNNNDGIQNTTDAGIPGVEVQLFRAPAETQVLTNALGARVLDAADTAPVLTDANGDYIFTNLLPGDYYVVIPTAPVAAPISSNNAGIAFLETDPDDNMDGDDEGVQPAGSGGSVSSDTISLALRMEPVNGTGATDESGQGNLQDDAFDDNGNVTVDFGFFAPVSVGDTAFVDLDGDGLQTMGEPGIGGVTVILIGTDGDTVMVDADGNMISGVTTTDPDGNYLFENLPPGSYSVIFDISTADNAEFYDFTTANAGIDTDDSDNSVALTDSTAQSDFVPFLNSGEQDLSLDVGVICAIEVTVADPLTICFTQPIILNDGASITPASLGGSWSTPDGTGEFTTGMDFATATTYLPSKADAQRGSVILILTTDEPNGPCEAVSNQVTIQILNVDCGDFLWDGQ